ncbi:MAG: ketoacyl-ACP synthase III [Bacteroidales bacterium]|nr:ketoacyl-ACP synthase III [Bacteroidales bacterium]
MKIAYSLPVSVLSNETIASMFPKWTAVKIEEKTGVRQRHVVGSETVLDMAESASRKLLDEYSIKAGDFDFVLLCTQSPVFALPPTACILQHRLGVPTTAGALDYDLGCSGFIYGLSLAKGLIRGGMANNVLLVTAESYSKYLRDDDVSTRTIFGDGAAAVVVDDKESNKIGNFIYGTDGGGADKLIVKNGKLHMDGPEIFNFTLDIVPEMIEKVLAKNNLTRGEIDYYVFHQANKFMLKSIRSVANLPKDRYYINLNETGNTVSSTIPIALKQLEKNGKLAPGMKLMLMGFGVGLSWGATILEW